MFDIPGFRLLTSTSDAPAARYDLLFPIVRARLIEDYFTPMSMKVPSIPIYFDAATPIRDGNDYGVFFWSGGYSAMEDETLKYVHIWINVTMLGRDVIKTSAILAHELVHTALSDSEGRSIFTAGEASHGPEFEAIVRKLGLDGPAKATTPGPAFIEWFKSRVWPDYETKLKEVGLDDTSAEPGAGAPAGLTAFPFVDFFSDRKERGVAVSSGQKVEEAHASATRRR